MNEELIKIIKDRSDVPCDNTGVGVYPKTPFEDSLSDGEKHDFVLDENNVSGYNTRVLGVTPRSTSVRENP